VKTILVTFLTFLLILPVSAIGEIQTITHTVKQPFAGSQSPDDARISAVAKAKREALEMAGTYIESLTVVKDSQVDKDEILALTAGVLKAEVVSQKNYASEDAFGIDVVVKVVVDTSVLEERVKKLLLDKTHLTQLRDAQKREKELLQRVSQLEEENRKPTAKKQNTQELKKEFQQASRGLTAVDWFYKAEALWVGGKYTDPKKAIEYLNNAIKLQPDYPRAYNVRGYAYDRLGQYQRAIEDYNEALRLKPDDSATYINRGVAYFRLGQHQRAIEDYNEAIRLKPDNVSAYINRGSAYKSLGQHQRAIEDFNEIIRMKPADFRASTAYYSRGAVYGELSQHQRAIEDYNEAIRLQPDFAFAYTNRGNMYLLQGKIILGCRDVQKACELGFCTDLEWAKSKGYCR
jgi:tetratricopeptide (TPR) repeat protein